MTTVFFGERWDAPRLDGAQQVDTPVGRPCLMCQETIELGDRGFLTGVVRQAGVGSVEPIHAECQLADILGHSVGICSCTGWAPGRARAKAVWQKIAGLKTSRSGSKDDAELLDELTREPE